MVTVIRPENARSSGTCTGNSSEDPVLVVGFARMIPPCKVEIPFEVAVPILADQITDAEAGRLLAVHFGTGSSE